jgi:hypothetical protein
METSRGCLCGHSRAGVDRDARDLAVSHLAFARVQPGPDGQAELAHTFDDRAGGTARQIQATWPRAEATTTACPALPSRSGFIRIGSTRSPRTT